MALTNWLRKVWKVGKKNPYAVDRNSDKKIAINCFPHVKVVLESGSMWQL